MDRWPGVLGAVLLFCCSVSFVVVGVTGVTAGTGVTTGVDDAAAGVGDGPKLTSQAEGFERTTYLLTVYENGSVQWTVRRTKPLNESEVQAYRDFAERFNSNETELYRSFVQAGERLTRIGRNQTGRSMTASNFQREAFVAKPGELGANLQTLGVVEMSFTWSAFARVTDGQVVLGDAFTNGLRLGEDMDFVVIPAERLAFVSATPDPDSVSGSTIRKSGSITWNGPRVFNDAKPRVVLEPVVAMTTTITTPSLTPTTTVAGPTSPTLARSPTTASTQQGSGSGGGSDIMSMLPILLVVLVLGAGTGGVYYITNRGDGGTESGGVSTETGSSGGTDSPPSPSASGADAEPAEPEQESAVSDDALLSDTDRVKSLLDDNGGRMRQSAIVEETEWSKSKVSMLLSDMEEEDEIRKLRVGRENIISLPGKEPEAAGSPFEDDEQD